jgi:Tfp pilus assembly PilM family ATPase
VKGGVGIELRDGAVTVACVRIGRTPRLNTFVSVPVSPAREGESRDDALARTVRELWEKYELAVYPSAAALDAKDCILRQIVVPFTHEEKIRRMIRFEAENYLHACAIEDVVVDYFKVDEVGGKAGILLVAGRKETIQNRLAALGRGGVDPEILDLDVVALFNAFVVSPQYRAQGATIVIDVGAEAVRLLLVIDGMLKRVRSFRVQATTAAMIPLERQIPAAEGTPPPVRETAAAPPAGDQLDAREGRFAAPGEEAPPAWEAEGEEPVALFSDEDLVVIMDATDTGAGEGAPPPAAGAAPAAKGGDRGPLYERIFAEAHRTFASAVLAGGVDLVCLTGPESRRPEAQRFFAERFGAETVYLEFGSLADAKTGGDVAQASERGAVAIGLALRAAGTGTMGLDFRRESFRYEKRYARLRVPIFAAGMLLFTCLLLNCLYLVLERERHNQEYANVVAHAAQLLQTTVGEKPPAGRSVLRVTKDRWEGLKSLIGQGGAGLPEFIRILDIVDDVGSAVKKAGISSVVWQRMNYQTEIPKSVGTARRSLKTAGTGFKAGDIVLMWDPDPTTADAVEKAINENSKYVVVTQRFPETDKSTGRTKCRFELEFKESVLRRTQGSGARVEAETARNSEDAASGG